MDSSEITSFDITPELQIHRDVNRGFTMVERYVLPAGCLVVTDEPMPVTGDARKLPRVDVVVWLTSRKVIERDDGSHEITDIWTETKE